MSELQSLSVEIAAELPPASTRDVIAVCVLQDEPELSNAGGEIHNIVAAVMNDGDFKGEAESTLLVHAATAEGPRRMLLIGMGKHGDDDPNELRRVAATAVRQARDAKAKRLIFVVPVCPNENIVVRALAQV